MARSSTSWRKGESGNPLGRPRVMVRYRELLREQVTPTVFVRLVDKLIGVAMAGDLAAIKILLEYVIGRPDRQAQEGDGATPTGLPMHELVACLSDEEVHAMLDRLEAGESGAARE